MAAGAGTAMTYQQLLAEVQEDWRAARESKIELEESRLRIYELYRRFRRDVNSAGGVAEAVTGPFGWSKLTVPIIFWTVETIVPRVAVSPPTLVVSPRTPEAVPYAQAKELELQDTLERMHVRAEMHHALKAMVLYGDGPTKTSWDSVKGIPRFTAINWFDWFLSSEASRPDTAEVIFHRTWYTRRQLQRLSRMTDRNGKPLWHGLEEITGTETIEVGDSTFAARREASGQGQPQHPDGGGLYCLIECWYQDGTVVVLGGAQGDRIVQVRTSPYRDEYGEPVRPFVVFSNTPDPESPYAIGDAEMLEDHQSEISTLRNQAIDQTTVNIAAPVVYTGSISKAEIDAAFGQPGGALRVPNGDVRTAVMRVSPGNVSSDFYNFYENVRAEAQLIAGVNDNQAGQAATSSQTATEIEVINAEANKRWQFKIAITEDRMARVGRLVDLHERRYGRPGKAIMLPKGATVRDGQRGLMSIGGAELPAGTPLGGAARTSPMVNAEGAMYEVTVKAGSLALPSEREEFAKVMALADALGINEAIMGSVNWSAVAKLIVETAGFDPEKVLLSDEEMAQQEMVAALEQQLAAAPAAEPVPAA